MRRSASEIIRNLERRIARLEKQSSKWGPAELCYTGKSTFDRSAKCLQPKFGFKTMKIVKDNGKFDWDGNSVLTVGDLSVASPDGYKKGRSPRVQGFKGKALSFYPYMSFNLNISNGDIDRWLTGLESKLGVSVRMAKVVDVRVSNNSYVEWEPSKTSEYFIEGEMTLALTIMGSRQKELVDVRFKAIDGRAFQRGNFLHAWAMIKH
jgi:hypothetical protein